MYTWPTQFCFLTSPRHWQVHHILLTSPDGATKWAKCFDCSWSRIQIIGQRLGSQEESGSAHTQKIAGIAIAQSYAELTPSCFKRLKLEKFCIGLPCWFSPTQLMFNILSNQTYRRELEWSGVEVQENHLTSGTLQVLDISKLTLFILPLPTHTH